MKLYVCGQKPSYWFLFISLLLTASCGKEGSNSSIPDLSAVDSEIGQSDEYYLKKKGLYWRREADSRLPITNPDQENSILECQKTGPSDENGFCESVCIADTLKYAVSQPRLSLYQTYKINSGPKGCKLQLFWYDRTESYKRLEAYSGTHYGNLQDGRCQIDLNQPEFTGYYDFNNVRQKSDEKFSWINLDKTVSRAYRLYMNEGLIFTYYDPEITSDVTMHVGNGCLRRGEITQSFLQNLKF